MIIMHCMGFTLRFKQYWTPLLVTDIQKCGWMGEEYIYIWTVVELYFEVVVRKKTKLISKTCLSLSDVIRNRLESKYVNTLFAPNSWHDPTCCLHVLSEKEGAGGGNHSETQWRGRMQGGARQRNDGMAGE